MNPTLKRAPLLATVLLAGSSALAQFVSGPAVNMTPTQARNNTRMSISLSGNKIAYTYVHWGSNDAWVMNADGSNALQVWYKLDNDNHVDSRSDEWPALNADGSKVIWHAWTPGGGSTDLIMMDLTTGAVTQMTNAEGNEAWPQFSPDGTKIVFLSNRTGAYQVYTMNAEPESATNVPKRLTNFKSVKNARWTADGLRIMVSATTDAHANNEIYRFDATDANNDNIGDNLTRLTTTSEDFFAEQPSQPTVGSRIFFIANYAMDGRKHVFSMTPSGSDIRQATAADDHEDFAFAAADKLAVTSNTPGHYGYTKEQGYENADVMLYPLSTGTASGTVNGRVMTAPGKALEGATVFVYNGQTTVNTLTTDAQGRFTASLPAGAYTLSFDLFGQLPQKVYRGLVVAPGATVTKDFLLPCSESPSPAGVIPTISGDSVDVRWAPVTAMWTLKGYNVYRAPSENGPWTKANTSLIPASGTPSFVDSAPGDLFSAFYLVTAVTNDGSADYESGPSDIIQAANNLIFNPSFELTDANGDPIGWRKTRWNWGAGNTSAFGSTTDQYVSGVRSAYIETGASRGDGSFWDTDTVYGPPSSPGDKIVYGMYGRLKDAPTTNNAVGLLAYAPGDDGGASDWYHWDWQGTIAINGQTDPNHPWQWLFNQSTVSLWEEMRYSRVSAFWAAGGGDAASPGVSRAFFDEVRFQTRRVGATGVVVGRVVAQTGEPIPGASVKLGDRTATSGDGGLFIFRDVPTGPVSLSATVATFVGTKDVRNIGGARVDIVMPPMPSLKISGTVKLPDGTPVPNAPVRLVYGVGEDANQTTQTTTADAQGQYTFADPPKGLGATAIAAKAPGYAEGASSGSYGAYGEFTVDVTLGDPAPVVQVAKAPKAPTIDGVLSAGEWTASAAIPLAFQGSTETPGTTTTAYAMWDADNLYIAFEAGEPNPTGIQYLANSTDKVFYLWRSEDDDNGDDNFAFWLDVNRGAAAGFGFEQWQILGNLNPTTPVNFDVVWRDYVPFTWNDVPNVTGLTYKSIIDEPGKKWVLEVKIPFAGLAVPGGQVTPIVTAGTEWLGRIQRHRHQQGIDGTGKTGEDFAATSYSWSTLRFVNSITAVKGDLNGDSAVTIEDAQIACRIAAGLEAVGARTPQGDVAGNDQQVNLADALRIARKVNGLEPGFPQ